MRSIQPSPGTPRRARWLAVPLAALTTVLGLANPVHAAGTDVTPPSAPGKPSVVAYSGTGFTLTWAPSTDDVGVTGYRVQTVLLACGLLPQLRWSSTTSTLTVTDLVPGQSVTLEVVALDAAGNVSPPSPSTRITVPGPADTVPPSAPGTPVASGLTSRSVTLTWAPSTDDTRVATYSVAELAVLGGVRCATTQTTSVTMGWLSPNTTYVFVVTAIDWLGNESPRSGSVTVTTPPAGTTDTSPPTAPGTPSATGISPTSATLTWAASTDDTGVTGYSVLDVTTGAGVVVASGTTTTATVAGLTPARTYVFAVVARDAAGNLSAQSGQVRVTTPPQNVPPFTVTYRNISQWPGGFQAEVTIRNLGTAPIDGWTLSWTFPNGQQITQIWGAGTPTTSGSTVTVQNAPWNATIPAGGSVTFGFTGNWTGSNTPPVAFTLNGMSNAMG